MELNKVTHLFVVGFNAEYCCLFTSIAGVDRGYKVTYIEDASGTVNDEDTYEMKGLDIVDFVGSVLD
ncbi:isochorismatase family protein [Marinilactibacillus sp. Marseille-P9653]|uniref:isochorismatase family protein n=1 Tax=Marinilactibacillus sp. Marseille-P9653 TaxID=2866583 RepID=UPI0021063460|nr:isochorismatase family protein [Marinilactibacillus sp. Marseille-P9653]